MKKLLILFWLWTACIHGAEFVNLGFDQPTLSGSLTPVFPGQSIAPFFGRTSDLLRGWRLTLDGNMVETTIYAPWGSPSATRDGTVTLQQYDPNGAQNQFDGNYLILDSSVGQTFHEFRMSQTGLIPINAAGLSVYSTLRWSMLIDDLPVGEWFQAQNGPLDVSRFAGQSVKFEFVFQGRGDGVFDILGFTQVPEPSTWALMAVGSVVLAGAVRSRRKVTGVGLGDKSPENT